MLWVASIIASTTVASLAAGSVMFVLGRRFIDEFTRPGVTVAQDTPQWGGWTFPEAVDEPLQKLRRAVTFQTADGVLLRGEFWAQTQSATTIVISHGFHLPSVHFRSVAALEYAHGVNILLFDYRGHGESAPTPTTCGNAEINDLAAAVEVAARQPETARGQVYIHGFSMGAAVALLLPPNPAIAGIVADSSYARLDEMIHTIILQIFDQETSTWRGPARGVRSLLPMLTHLTLFAGQILFQARYRRSLIARPDLALSSSISKRILPPILLIHAENDPLVTLHHARRLVTLARAAGRAIQVYYTPCAIHCGSYGYDPQRYMALLQEFIVPEESAGTVLPALPVSSNSAST